MAVAGKIDAHLVSGCHQGPGQRTHYVGQAARFGEWHTLRGRKSDVHQATPYKVPAPAPPAHAIIGCCSQHTLLSGANRQNELASLNAGTPAGKRVNVTKIAAAEKPHSRPKLGQHFLVDSARHRPHCGSPGRYFGEHGPRNRPGRGALTAMLARRARRLIAIEIDRVLAAQLRMNFSQEPNVEIIEGDVLAIDFHTLFGPKPGSTRPGHESSA